MSRAALSAFVSRASRTPEPLPVETDGELLTRFVRDRDEGAFAALIHRFGPMVLGVCRRVTRDAHLAEDAFQAAFVVLAQRGADVYPAGAVRSWLYGVAVRTAREARTVAARRHAREVPVAQVPDRAAELAECPDADALRALDEEVGALPEHLRAAVVLCELDGLSRTDAAERLGVPEGTLSSRLAKARKLLASRLRARGISAPAVGLAVLTQAVLAPALVARTSALLHATAPLPRAVATISNGVLRTMFLRKQTLGSAGAALLAVACLAAWGALPTSAAKEQPKANPPLVLKAVPTRATQPPAAKPAAPGRLLVWKETKHVFLTPDGKEGDTFVSDHPDKKAIFNEPVLSPDGKIVAFRVNDDPPTDQDGNRKQHLYFRDAEGKKPGVKIELNPMTLAWDSDGKALLVTEFVPAKELKDTELLVWRVDIATQKKTKLDLPKHTVVYAAAPDGEAFVGAVFDFKAMKISLATISRDGKDVTKLCEVRNEMPNPRLSPDGTKFLFQDYDADEKPAKGTPPLRRLFVYDLKAQSRKRVAEIPVNASLIGYCWSPDGKHIAYTWKQVQPGVPLAVNTENMNDPKLNTETESHLIISDATGKNPKTVMSIKSEFAPRTTIGALDWR